MTVELTEDEALVLFDLLADYETADDGTMLRIKHAAERNAFWALEAALERQLPPPSRRITGSRWTTHAQGLKSELGAGRFKVKLVASVRISNSNSGSRLRFTTTGGGSWKVWDRYLSLDERQLVHLGNVCGTCEFFFRHIAEPPLDGFDLDAVRGQLERGLETLDPFINQFRPVLPNGDYVACLFEGGLAKAGSSTTCPDYFSAEQSEVWARDAQEPVTGLSDYYRGDSVGIAETEKLFEFVVPLVSRERLQGSRVDHYVRLLESGARPTAVAISVLDVKRSMNWPADDHGNEVEPKYATHWCFAHYLIDGHHKVAAAAESGQVISVLSFIALEPSWFRIDDLLEKYKVGLRP